MDETEPDNAIANVPGATKSRNAKTSAYKSVPSASCAASSIFALPRMMTSLAVSPRIQQSSMSAHACMSARLGPDIRAQL
jgi:hypothetical protein